MDANERQLIQILIRRAGSEYDVLSAQDEKTLDRNSQTLLTVLEKEHLITRCFNNEIQEPNSLSHGQIGSYYFSLESVENIKLFPEVICSCIIAVSLNSDIRAEILCEVLTCLVRSCQSLTENECEVLNQFRTQAQKQNQLKYDAGVRYEDLKKGFDPDGTIPFDATLESLLSKGILVKSSEDYYHLIR